MHIVQSKVGSLPPAKALSYSSSSARGGPNPYRTRTGIYVRMLGECRYSDQNRLAHRQQVTDAYPRRRVRVAVGSRSMCLWHD
jgi:hypothetical protein